MAIGKQLKEIRVQQKGRLGYFLLCSLLATVLAEAAFSKAPASMNGPSTQLWLPLTLANAIAQTSVVEAL